MRNLIQKWLLSLFSVSYDSLQVVTTVAVVFVVLVASVLLFYLSKKYLVTVLSAFVKRTKNKWDDALLNDKVLARFSLFVPLMVVYFSASQFGFQAAGKLRFRNIIVALMLFLGARVIGAILSSVIEIYRTYEVAKHKPIKGYVQLLKVFIWVFALIFITAYIMGRSPWGLVTGIGALSAVLMLIFKDSILSLVASIQLSGNDMVRIGDWIVVPSANADGDVIDISLNTVKIQNWDKTISTVPTYSLISGSFINWRGMAEANGRRIKRAVNIDMNSISFASEETLNKFRKIQYISEYIDAKHADVNAHNSTQKVDTSLKINGRNLTNIGTFRAYVSHFLQNHPKISKEMTFLVRQLAPTSQGLPIEIYVFCTDKVWANYEAVQSDIFDHLLAVIPEFGLRVFQQPTGLDFASIAE